MREGDAIDILCCFNCYRFDNVCLHRDLSHWETLGTGMSMVVLRRFCRPVANREEEPVALGLNSFEQSRHDHYVLWKSPSSLVAWASVLMLQGKKRYGSGALPPKRPGYRQVIIKRWLILRLEIERK